MMIEIGRKKAVCEYCDSELYIDEIVSEHTITERRSRTITRAIQHAPLI